MNRPHFKSILMLISFLLLGLVPVQAWAAESLCAEVKIEIKQELSLERQAFDAHMRINNGLSNISLDHVKIVVNFMDENNNPVTASFDPNADPSTTRFFIRVDSMENITDVDGQGVVSPSTSADIHWLIIPTQGAAGGQIQGKLYYVGATLTYQLGGEENVTQVTPDYIYVKPLPDLALDYFMPEDVYGDDAFTDAIEPPVPYALGLRVKNIGQGIARNVKIESAQPKIIENKQGLLVGFVIESSEANGKIAPASLLAALGDIAPESAGTARWIMTTTLSGRFTNFTASVAHANELGGDLTSLIKTENLKPHTLVRDVLTDLPGRDGIRDFLAKDGSLFKLYESSGVDTQVVDFSGDSSLTPAGASGTTTNFTLTTTANAGFSYICLSDPHAGSRILKGAVRSDGKLIKPENAWLSKTRKADPAAGWNYFVNLFDAQGTSSYTLTFDDPGNLPQAPVLGYIADHAGVEGQQLGFLVEASDPNGTVPKLTAEALPAGATLTDSGNGSAVFDWTPNSGQAGTYTITFKASDGVLSSTRRAVVSIHSLGDSDGDGLPDSWEMAHFGTLDRDGTGDFDGDGISDLDEFLNGTDPERADHAPSVPLIISPAAGAEVDTLLPQLTVENSTDADGDPITYEFQVFSDESLAEPVAVQTGIAAGNNQTSWTVTVALADNTTYIFRVRACDQASRSLWAYGRFMVNTANDTPSVPLPCDPAQGRMVDTLTPVLTAMAAGDADNDSLAYTFEIYDSADMANLLTTGPGMLTDAGRRVVFAVTDAVLADQATYYWKVFVSDEHGLENASDIMAFTVNLADHAPTAPGIILPAPGSEVTALSVDITVTNSLDADGDALTYEFELDTQADFNSPAKRVSGPLPAGDVETMFAVTGLSDNTRYYLRVRADDGLAPGPFSFSSFFVNTVNNLPATPVVKNPDELAWTTTLAPTLGVGPAKDVDEDELTYHFEIYDDADLTQLIQAGDAADPEWVVPQALTVNTRYYFRGKARDEHGLASPWSPVASFFVSEEAAPASLAVQVKTGKGVELQGLNVYAFTQAGAYTGIHAQTDAGGKAAFDPAAFNAGAYKFRADYLGRQFWTTVATLPGTALINLVIPTETVTLAVTTAAGPAENVHVYVFSPTGSYLALFADTDDQGHVSFELPAGSGYNFRADLLGNQYWSNVQQVVAGTANAFAVNSGGGELAVYVGENATTALPGLRVYLFHQNESYLNLNSVTDDQGRAAFDVPAGTYKVRADYLGYQFFSAETSVTADTSANLLIPHADLVGTVTGEFQGESTPLAGLNVYLFNKDSAYQNRHFITDGEGRVTLHLPAKAYKIRADYLGRQFMSEEFTQTDVNVAIPMADVNVRVGWNTAAIPGVSVYAFSAAGAYLSLHGTTDAAGEVQFRLPSAGIYRFRADYQAGQFWSGDTSLLPGEVKAVDISTGGGAFAFSVQKGPGEPIPGVNCHVFSETGAYFGVHGPTSSDGEVTFDLADNIYNIRVDYLGYQFWSYNHDVPEVLSGLLTIPHQDTAITVSGSFNGTVTPIAGVPVYLFTKEGAYQNRSLTTDGNGRVTFNLPTQEYKVRTDYLGRQFWSGAFQQQDTAVAIPMADAEILVTFAGQPVAGVPVYAFTATHSYLNLHATTNAEGKVLFRLPAAGVYDFRADYQGSQFWSGEAGLTADQLNPVEINTGGGLFTFTVLKAENMPLTGATCYVFNEQGAYLNLNAVTSSEGQVSFGLADGRYKIRVDHLGYQYMSPVMQIPGSLSGTFTIPHADVTVSVNSLYQGVLEPMAGLKVYLFTQAGAYQNVNKTTDAAGQAAFNLPPGQYRLRVDYLSQQFWSAYFSQTNVTVDIPMAEAAVTVSGAGQPLGNVPVYAFTGSRAYLNLTQTTAADGKALFRLPAAGVYDFRADYQGSQYWADDAALAANQVNIVPISTGGGVFQLTLFKEPGLALAGIRCYVFNAAGSYLGLSGTSDAQGRVSFNLADGTYKFRVDYLGYQFWTGLHTVPTSLADDFVIAHQNTTVTVQSLYQTAAPLGNVRVYLFTQGGAYQNIYQNTDAQGRVVFSLPQKAYKVRADYLGYQFWSDPFTWTDQTVSIPHGLAKVHALRSGVDQPGARVYLFTGAGSYQSRYVDTNAAGLAEFLIPNQAFKFRVDHSGKQVWSGVVTVTPGGENVVEVELN